mmetsp:Transcript_47057/g.116512  ORF Transcript_47057/g.116512 Transcript_47057/m.116512 type:complete len:255 (+) Transcript_47057:118-882(+)
MPHCHIHQSHVRTRAAARSPRSPPMHRSAHSSPSRLLRAGQLLHRRHDLCALVFRHAFSHSLVEGVQHLAVGADHQHPALRQPVAAHVALHLLFLQAHAERLVLLPRLYGVEQRGSQRGEAEDRLVAEGFVEDALLVLEERAAEEVALELVHAEQLRRGNVFGLRLRLLHHSVDGEGAAARGEGAAEVARLLAAERSARPADGEDHRAALLPERFGLDGRTRWSAGGEWGEEGGAQAGEGRGGRGACQSDQTRH